MAKLRHLAIGHDDIRPLLLDLLPAFLAVAGADDFVSRPLKLEFRGAENMKLVVAEEDASGW